MKLTKFFALLCAALAFVGCEENGPDGPDVPNNVNGDLTLSADTTTIALGESVTFTVMQKDETTGESVDVTKSVTLYDADLNKIANPFTPTVSGIINVTATKGKYTSNTVAITVMAQMPKVPADPQPENLAFNHRAIVIDHTGVNCGYCPGMTDKLLALAETEWHKHYNEVTCHAGGMAGGDPGNSAAANALNQMQSNYIAGYPNICINFHTATVGNYGQSAFLQYMAQAFEGYIKKNGADVGIALSVEGDATSIYCAAQVKAKEAKEYKVVAWLLENNIYSPNQAGATKDYHKIYNYALRNISGEYSRNNVAGESVGVIEAGQTYDCAFTLPIVSTKWNWENMGALVIVSAKNANNQWEVVNSAYCPVKESKAFEYVE
ncbi:MAG: Omp28-related outer membrane protein [Alistipes sp.]|nr:Omp28-related outer membrane protein [Alistipes sp.]